MKWNNTPFFRGIDKFTSFTRPNLFWKRSLCWRQQLGYNNSEHWTIRLRLERVRNRAFTPETPRYSPSCRRFFVFGRNLSCARRTSMSRRLVRLNHTEQWTVSYWRTTECRATTTVAAAVRARTDGRMVTAGRGLQLSLYHFSSSSWRTTSAGVQDKRGVLSVRNGQWWLVLVRHGCAPNYKGNLRTKKNQLFKRS